MNKYNSEEIVSKTINKSNTTAILNHFLFLLLFIVFFDSHSQINKYEHYFTSNEVGSFLVGDKELFWDNPIGVFKKNLSTNKVEMIRRNYSKISRRAYFIGYDDQNKLWIQNSFIPKYSIYDGQNFITSDTIKVNSSKIPLNNLRVFVIDKNKRKWIINKENELYIIDKKDVLNFKNIGFEAIKGSISCITFDFTGNLWISTYKEIFKFDLNEAKLIKIETEGLFEVISKNISIISIGIDNRDNIWVAQIPRSAIGIYENANKKWRKVTFNENPSFIGVNQILIDEDNTKWFTSSNGIILINGKDSKIYYNDSTSKSSYGIQLDSQKNAYVSYLSGTIYKFENEKFKQVFTNSNPLESNLLNAIYKDDKSIWINASKGLHKFDGKNWMNFDFATLGQGNHKYLNDFYIDKQGNRWFGTTTGLFKFNKVKWEIFDRDNKGLKSDFVNAFLFDSKNKLWIGTREGLFRYDQDSIPCKIPINPNVRFNEFIKFIKKDSEGNIWVARDEYSASLYKYNEKTDTFSYFLYDILDTKNDNSDNLYFLSSKEILTTFKGDVCVPDLKVPSFNKVKFYKMLFDNDTLWILLSNGHLLKSTKGKFEIYKNPIIDDISDGITCFTINDSKVYFGTHYGLFVVKLKELEKIELFSNW